MSLYLMFCSNKQCYVALELSRGKFNVKAAWSYYVPYNFKGVLKQAPRQGAGKTMLTFSVTFRFPLPPRPFSVVPAGGEGMGQAATEPKYIDISGKR
jgi:hypothetical protein